MKAIAERYRQLLEKIPAEVRLICVTKQRSISEIEELYEAGCRDFGESRVQEALDKISSFPDDIRWHLIGTLQTKKVKKVIGRFHLIHSVDSLELAKKISEESVKAQKKTAILLQANTSGETSKHGLIPEQWKSAFEELLALPALEICGLMTMAPLTEDELIVHRAFALLRHLRDELQQRAGQRAFLVELSMGMSHDWQIALAEDATMLRIGTLLYH